MSLQDALDTLSAAHGAQALAAAFHAVEREARRKLKVSRETFGLLARTYWAAMDIYDAQKAEGVPRAERLAGLEKSLRAVWPQTREWHYLCVACSDLGLELRECDGNTSCGRHKAHLPHTYGVPCLCAKGAAFQPVQKPAAADFKAAGKMTRMGR